jgi:hypothetical protein
LRFALANAMFWYGVAKLVVSQFGFPDAERLAEPLGALSPMALLWTFMGYSPAYSVFTGAAEFVAGVLLVFRRTALLGALLAMGVLANVVMLNLAYDVCVKLYAMHLLLMAVLLVVPHARRLFDALVLERAVPAVAPSPLVSSVRARSVLAWSKAAYLAIAAFSFGAVARDDLREKDAPPTPLAGVYDVETFVRGGREVPPLLTDDTRWRRVVIQGDRDEPHVAVWSMRDTRRRLTGADDAEHHTLSLDAHDSAAPTTWTYATPDADHLVLTGRTGDEAIEVRLCRTDDPSQRLARGGFHWLRERAFGG